MRAIEKIIVHCSATPPEQDIGVEEIRSWHQERGWCDVATIMWCAEMAQ
ncbi:hypothetical protein [Porphyromonas gingivicanis]|nr:hypothetical protein [Porphyromonas gingivicanis]